jgi:hypothetical protein
MKKVIFTLVFIVVMAVPCLLLAADSYFLQFLGLIYTIGYVINVLFPVYKRVHILLSN